jgi:hypothetical protein
MQVQLHMDSLIATQLPLSTHLQTLNAFWSGTLTDEGFAC